MKSVIDTSEVLGTVEAPEGTCEVGTSAGASFDEAAGRLAARLEASLRPAALFAKERHFRANWLQENETVTESVGRGGNNGWSAGTLFVRSTTRG